MCMVTWYIYPVSLISNLSSVSLDIMLFLPFPFFLLIFLIFILISYYSTLFLFHASSFLFCPYTCLQQNIFCFALDRTSICNNWKNFDLEISRLRQYFTAYSYSSYLFEKFVKRFLINKCNLSQTWQVATNETAWPPK